MLATKLYPKAHEGRIDGHDKALSPLRKAFLKGAFINFALLQLLFLCLFAYVFGSLFQQNSRVHSMNVLFLDYDGGAVGESVREAYRSLEGEGFPTLLERPSSQYPIEGLREEACRAKYWSILYTSPGASARLQAALGGGLAATAYDRSKAITFIWNEARYSATVDSVIASNLQTLSSVARVLFQTNGTIVSLAQTDPAAVAVFSDPWKLTDINIQPTTQGSRAIYNTIVVILVFIQEFFYLGTLNGLYAAFKIYTKLYPHRIIVYRNCISLAYTFVGSLCTTSMIWAFRSGWNVNGNQFVLCWMVLWLFAHANFLAFDVFTIWLPPQCVPMALISWIVLNVSSILLPFELSSGFYRWAYVMPAHEVYQVLTDIWSRGCNPQLHYALPILFALEIVGQLLSGLGVYHRCHFAILAKEAEEQAFQETISAAVAFERKRFLERAETKDERPASDTNEQAQANIEEVEREELAQVIRDEEDQLRRSQTRASRNVSFGPSFDLAYRNES